MFDGGLQSEGLQSGNLQSGSLLSGGLQSHATDLGAGNVVTCLGASDNQSGSLQSGSLRSRATDLRAGGVLTWSKKRYRGPLNIQLFREQMLLAPHKGAIINKDTV